MMCSVLSGGVSGVRGGIRWTQRRVLPPLPWMEYLPLPLPPSGFCPSLFLRLLRPCLRQSTAQGSVEEEEEQGELFCILGG